MELKLHKNFYKLVSFVFSALLIAWAVYLIYTNPDFVAKFQNSLAVFVSNYKHPVLYLVIFLLFVNWGIEAYKWKILVEPELKISNYQSFRSVLLGLSTSFFTPRSVGEYFGRILSLPVKNKLALTGAVLLAQVAQLIATLSLGIFGLLLVYKSMLAEEWGMLLGLSLLLIVLIAILFMFRTDLLKWVQQKIPKVFELLRLLKVYSKQTMLKVLFWSYLRHFTYSIQLILVVYLLKPEINLLGIFPYVCLVYLAKTIIPSFNMLTDIGVREFSNLFFLGLYGIEPQVALLSGMFIWMVNIMFPTLLGGILLWRK